MMGTTILPATAQPGDELPVLETTVSRVQMFFFSAATYNGHRIHYDHDWATTVEGHSDVLVQGPLQNALMMRLLTDWVGTRGRVVSISTTNRASAYPERPLRFCGTVTGRRDAGSAEIVDVELRALDEKGSVLMSGTASLSIGAGR
jgi:hydroxyacyl-ACP dehydratase HTD2-like protein with hotdog domain